MAEEVNTSEQEQTPQPTLPTVQQDNQPDVSFLQYLPESIKTPARPSAASIYSKYVGNPLTGSDPGERFTSSGQPKVDPMQAAATKSLAYENKYAALKPFTYSGDFDKARFERYYSAKDAYNKLGFNPYANNEDLYNKNMTFGDRFVRAAGQWDNLIASGFMSGVRSWKTIFTDPLAPDVEGARDMERIMQEGADTTGGIGAFFNNTFLNSGYTVGIGLNFLGEELALMGATALSEGTLSGVTLPAMVARTGSALNKMFEGSKIIGGALKNLTRMDGVRAINSIPEARSFWSTVGKGAKTAGKGVFEMVNPLENTYQALKATDYATDFAKMSKTFGAFADDILMMKNVVAEAKIEGGLVKINATQELIDLYVAQNGRQPEGKALQEIEEIASKEAYRTAALNLPAIGVTNKLMYATMLAPLRNVMGKQAVPLLEDIIFNKKTFTSLGEGLLDKGSAALKSLAKPKFYGQFGMNYLTANLAEGVQENLQEAISYGAVAHAKAMYTNPIRAAHDGYMSDLKEGLKQQFSRQGAETFASGFLMGAFAQPIMAIPSMGISKLVRSFNTEQYEAAKQTKKNAIQKEVDILNEQYKSPLDFYAPDLGNAVKTGSLADDMYSAGRVGNKKEAMDAQAAIQNQHMITAFKTGKYDIIRKRLADYENFTAEETVEAFKKYGIEEKDYEKASAKIKEVIARADRTKEVYENVAKKYPNPINVSNYKRGTPEREAAEISKIAWDEAVSNLVFAHATMDSHSKRIADIAKTFSAISNDMAGEDAQSLMSMLSTTTLAKEVVALANEVKVLDDNIPAQKKIKAKKEKQLEKIDKYFSAIKDIEEAKTPEEKAKAEEKAKDAFGDYVKFLANKNEKLIFDDSLEDAYNMVRDSMLLKNDMKGLVDSINVLMTPQNFLNLHARLYNAHEEMFKNKETIINNNVNLHHEIKDTNDAINLIYQENKLSLSPESLDAIKEAKNKNENLPANITFVDEDGNAVTSGPRFENAMKTWKVLLDLTKKEAKPVEEEIEEEETEEEEVEKELQPFDPEDVSTYPDSLMNDLEDMYELYKESSLIDEGDTFDMFLKTQTAKVIIKNAELAVKLQEERKEKKPDLLQRINNAGTPEELDEIDAEIQKAGALTKELIDATNKKRESFKKTTTTPTNIEAKKADIEKRRQEELKPYKQEYVDSLIKRIKEKSELEKFGMALGLYSEGRYNPIVALNGIGHIKEKGIVTKNTLINAVYNIWGELEGDKFTQFLESEENSSQGLGRSAKEQINAKYDAELKALQGKPETDIESERDKLEEEKDQKLNKLFESVGLAYTQKSLDAILERNDKRAIAFIEEHDNIIAEYEKKLAALEDKTAEETGKKTKYKKPRKKKTKDGKQLTIDLEGPENINENYKGAIIYMTPSSIVDLEGYPTVINTDDISIDFIIEQVPNVNLKWYAKTYKNEHNWKAQVIYDAIAHAGVDGNKLREKVSKRAKELAAEGNTVLTGSNYYVKDADYVMIQTNPEINKNMPNYPIQNAIYEAKVENKPVILINQMFDEALKQTPQELSDKDLEFINEDSEITIEDINKKITQKGLYIARDRGYDVFYKNKRYAIVNISGNSVSLSSIDGEKINVKVSEISSVVDPTGGQASKSDISTFKNNENNIQSGKVNIDFEEKNINKVIKDIEDNIC